VIEVPSIEVHTVANDSLRTTRTIAMVKRAWRAIEQQKFYPCPSVMNCVTSPSEHPVAIGETDLTRLHQLNKNTQGTKTMETALTVACIIGLVAWVFHQGRRKGSRQGYRAGWHKSRWRNTQRR